MQVCAISHEAVHYPMASLLGEMDFLCEGQFDQLLLFLRPVCGSSPPLYLRRSKSHCASSLFAQLTSPRIPPGSSVTSPWDAGNVTGFKGLWKGEGTHV